MIELIKKEIHMNRQRGTAVSQLTLDDDLLCRMRWMMRCRYCCQTGRFR